MCLYSTNHILQQLCSKTHLNDKVVTTFLTNIMAELVPSTSWNPSYSRSQAITNKPMTYDRLHEDVLKDKLTTLTWLMSKGVIMKDPECFTCGGKMKLEAISVQKATSDGYRWRCRSSKPLVHQCTMSVRKKSWFEKSNLTIKELLQFTDWWSRKVPQDFLEHELGLSSATCVDWAYFAEKFANKSFLTPVHR
ncbi:hypothetical protein BSL78_24361 [Apostichopus japonicus]|uniref:Uncharacterized protein n=1 Tax=Stichopus japonicus TaxID=307972 RepID=A0A2G8JSR7_STIJA|nr:hypothetical protein BSL78_24361 [Apostichopus japonicus]